MKPNNLNYLLASLAAVGCTQKNEPQKTTPDKPNIVVILADDMGFSDLSMYGGEIPTPHLDSLAANGIKFSHFTNSSRCCPSRAALLTGLYPHRAGVGDMIEYHGDGPYQGFLSDSATTIAEALRPLGYTTLMAGKWHVGEEKGHWPIDRGFDKYFGSIGGAGNYYGHIEKDPRRKFAHNDKIVKTPHDGFYVTTAFTDSAMAFIEQNRNADQKPFFLYLAYTAPHWPLHAPEAEIQKFLGKYMGGWDSLSAVRFERQKQLGLFDHDSVKAPKAKSVPDWDTTSDKPLWDRRMATYAAMVSIMDQNIGRLLAYLRATNQLENTVIMFLSDNGACAEDVEWIRPKLHTPNAVVGTSESYDAIREPWAFACSTPYRFYKADVYMGGNRTPFIYFDGRKPIGRPNYINHLANITDILPTCVELAGEKFKPANGKISNLNGKSFLPLLAENAQPTHTSLGWEHQGRHAWIKGDLKLIFSRDKEFHLYNLASDPTEIHDVKSNFPSEFENMKNEMDAYLNQIGYIPHDTLRAMRKKYRQPH